LRRGGNLEGHNVSSRTAFFLLSSSSPSVDKWKTFISCLVLEGIWATQPTTHPIQSVSSFIHRRRRRHHPGQNDEEMTDRKQHKQRQFKHSNEVSIYEMNPGTPLRSGLKSKGSFTRWNIQCFICTIKYNGTLTNFRSWSTMLYTMEYSMDYIPLCKPAFSSKHFLMLTSRRSRIVFVSNTISA
jgi:hypothetical protein